MTVGKLTDLILLDFSKAFNKVSHLKLPYKLQVYGVQGKTLGWIESLLVGISQTIVLDGGESSDELPELPYRRRKRWDRPPPLPPPPPPLNNFRGGNMAFALPSQNPQRSKISPACSMYSIILSTNLKN